MIDVDNGAHRRRPPLVVVVLALALLACGVVAAQTGGRVLPITAPRAAGPDNVLLIADMGTNRLIRLTDFTGTGWEQGPTAAGLSLHSPWHVTFDAAGRIYVVDRDNKRIVQTDDVAGTGWKAFSSVGSNRLVRGGIDYIASVGLDAQGRIYVTGSDRVVRIDNMDGAGWTTFDPGGGLKNVVFDSQGRIYISDNGFHRIIRVNDMQGNGRVNYGSYGYGDGLLNEPEGMTLDAQGRIYFSDESNHRIVRINDMSGAGFTTLGVHGKGDGQLSLPHGIQVDSLGRIYIADTGNQRIVRVNSMAGDGWVVIGFIGCSTNCGNQPTSTLPFHFTSPKGLRVRGTGPTLTYLSVFPQITIGDSYRTSLIGINPRRAAMEARVAFLRNGDGCRCAGPLPVTVEGESTNGLTRTVAAMGTVRLDATGAAARANGYATLDTDEEIHGVELVTRTSGGSTTGEAAIALSHPMHDFTIYIDNTNGGSTGYTIVNPLPTWRPPSWNAQTNMTLRDKSGVVLATSGINLGPGQMLTELASERFPGHVGPGFEGTIQMSTGTSSMLLRTAALRYGDQGTLTAMPIVAARNNPEDDWGKTPDHKTISRPEAVTLHFPHVADGGGYRSSFLLMNPANAPVTATLDFFASDGSPLSLPIGGTGRTWHVVQLGAAQSLRVDTDGTSPAIRWGWARVTTNVREYWHEFGGGVVLRAAADGRTLSEALISPVVLASHITTYVDSLRSTESGVALANPNTAAATALFRLRNEAGDPIAETAREVPAHGHLAQFATQLFPDIGEFEGTLEVETNRPVAGVGLRYESVDRSVFTTLPVVTIP